MASVIHGFIYNKDAFDELGLVVFRETEAEFFAVLDKIKEDGTYIPMAMGTNDQWEAATMGYNNIGPNYWKGEEGRLTLIEGDSETDGRAAMGRPLPPAWRKWGAYLGDGFEAQTYPDSQNLFTLGRAAIYPAGSLGDLAASITWPISRWALSSRRSRMPGDDLLYLGSHRHRHWPERSVRPTPMRHAPSLNWVASPRNSPQIYRQTPCPASSRCPRQPSMWRWRTHWPQEFVELARTSARLDHPVHLSDPVAWNAEP